MSDHSKLKQLAEDTDLVGGYISAPDFEEIGLNTADATFAAAANPAVVLALIEENERLSTQLRLAGVSAEVTVHQEVGRAITETLSVTIERDQLKAENEALRKERDNLREDRDGLLEAGAHLL